MKSEDHAAPLARQHVAERREHGAPQPGRDARGGGGAGQLSGGATPPGSGVSHTVTMPTSISAAITA